MPRFGSRPRAARPLPWRDSWRLSDAHPAQPRFPFIRNFKPDRWPAGDPSPTDATYDQLTSNTFIGYADIDAGPTKAWMITHRKEPQTARLYELATAKRPAQELYDLREDPYQMRNVAADAKYAETLKRLDAQLMAKLKETVDPRAYGKGDVFDDYICYQGRSMKMKSTSTVDPHPVDSPKFQSTCSTGGVSGPRTTRRGHSFASATRFGMRLHLLQTRFSPLHEGDAAVAPQ